MVAYRVWNSKKTDYKKLKIYFSGAKFSFEILIKKSTLIKEHQRKTVYQIKKKPPEYCAANYVLEPSGQLMVKPKENIGINIKMSR